MKKTSCNLLALLSIISPCMANDTFNMSVASLKEQALNKTHEKIEDGFRLLDIDGNGKLSRHECSGSGSTEALKSFPFFSQDELATLIKKIDQAFDTFDRDKDGYLDPTEGQKYISHVENLGIDMQMKKMDKNGDGEINADEIASFMQSMPSMEENIEKIKNYN